MTAHKPTTVPRLRFPEFRDSGEWEVETLGSVCELYQPETLAASKLKQDGPYFVYGANGVIGKHDRYNHEDSEIVVSCRGTCGEVNRTQPRSWITGNAMVVKSKDDRIAKTFIFHSLKSNDLKSIISGSAQPQITRAGFTPFLFAFPESKDEQQKIADCLGSLDDLIAADGRKLEALLQHKKGLLQQLFPQPGETVPLLRFPEFRDSGEWEVETLGSVCELYQPETLAASKLKQDGPYFVYGANGVIGKHDRYNHEDSEIVVSCRGTCGEVNRTQPRSWITGNAMVVKSKDDRIAKTFIFHSLKSNDLKSIISGSAQPQITRAGFTPFLFAFPESKDEQQKIADCLGSLDDLISADGRKLEALLQHKKGLLQQLFPSLEGQ